MENENMTKSGGKFQYLGSIGRIAAIYFVAFTIFMFCATLILILLTKSTKEVKVPNVEGKRFLEVYNQLERTGLRPKLSFKDAFDMDDGLILRQYPESGEIVTEGSPIKLDVTKSCIYIDVPTINGVELPMALNKLKNLHSQGRAISLQTGMITYIESDKYADNIVIDQSPRPGEKVTPDCKVNMLVSTGNIKTDNKMPDVVGQSVDLCFDHLRSKGVQVVHDIVETWDMKKSGIVLGQSPKKGALLKEGNIVRLKVYWYPLTDRPYFAYEKVEYTIPDDKGEGIYEAYVEDHKSKRIAFSRKMKGGQKISFLFHREGDAKVSIIKDKENIRVVGYHVEK